MQLSTENNVGGRKLKIRKGGVNYITDGTALDGQAEKSIWLGGEWWQEYKCRPELFTCPAEFEWDEVWHIRKKIITVSEAHNIYKLTL